jgi:hypothetical protein
MTRNNAIRSTKLRAVHACITLDEASARRAVRHASPSVP